MYRLPDVTYPFEFPDLFETSPEGLLALGGNLHPLTLISAYSKGIFPWFSEKDPILWWHPDPRTVIFPGKIHISRKMNSLIKKTNFSKTKSVENDLYHVTLNQDFSSVIEACSKISRKGQDQTWITKSMIVSYTKLHEMKYAHSIEVWNRQDKLVGGMYGVAIGKIFFGESMFSQEKNASKIALFHLCAFLKQEGFFLIDCQVDSQHLHSMGAQTISRNEFMAYLAKGNTHLKQVCLEFF